MNDRNGDRLDPEMAELLRQAEPYPEAPTDVQLRVHGALMERIAIAAAGNMAEGGAHESAVAPSPAPSTALLSLTTKPILTLAATFAVGASMGAGLHAVLQPPRERVVYVERAAATTAPSSSTPRDIGAPRQTPAETPAVPTSESAPAATGDDVARARRTPAPPREAAPSISDLGAEQALLDVARAALARGRADEALGPLDRHARQFPKGLLAEEREALAVNVLVTLSRYDEARERSARFLRRYPKSLLRASVEAAVEAIP